MLFSSEKWQLFCYITKLQLLPVITVITNENRIHWNLNDSPEEKAKPKILRYYTISLEYLKKYAVYGPNTLTLTLYNFTEDFY